MKDKINRAIKHYNYSEDTSSYDDRFMQRYNHFTDKDTLKNWSHTIYGVLSGLPNSTHIKAKKLLFQGSDECWEYFERTAVFWTYGHLNDKWIDHLKGAYEYALYVERTDLIRNLFEKSLSYLLDEGNLSNKDFINQKVYPSTLLLHFLLEKWTGNSQVKDLVLKYGDGYGIYQPLIDNWNDFSNIKSDYWDELCMYHLDGIGLQRGEKWENEEFLSSGLIPMELINLIKVRKKIGMDIPIINNALFDSNMAKTPIIPTGYNEHYDMKFTLVDLTVKTKRKYTLQEVEEYMNLKFPNVKIMQ
ncbi:hypothetical protein [Hoylesella buccalis]|uniref:hypothetical protein n=1 Tax=Hoylesella buccalis TaxID=28127 RepID=UPI0039916B56